MKASMEALYVDRCMLIPSGVRALQHPHPGPHVLQFPGHIKRYAAPSTHQDAGVVWTHLSLHHCLPAPAATHIEQMLWGQLGKRN